MKLRYMAFLSLVILALPSVGQAQDTLILDHMDSSIVSGTVTRVQGESLFITSSGRDIEIELDSLDVDGSINDLFKPGMVVTVKGRIEDDGHTPVLEAREIVQSQNGQAIMNSEALLLDND